MSEVIKLNRKNGGLKIKLYDEAASIVREEEENNHRKQEEENNYRKQLEMQMQEQYERGFQDGQNAIRLECEKDLTDRMVTKTEEFNKILSSLQENLSGYDQAFDKIIIEVSVAIAEKILKREINRESIITESLKESVRKILGANEILIHVNPVDYNGLNNSGADHFLNETFSKIKFEINEKLDPGGCMIETEIGNVDARIVTQLNEIKKQFETNFINQII
ncbi:MAG: FliH/SctL family protein [Ignavibacteria bacterium]